MATTVAQSVAVLLHPQWQSWVHDFVGDDRSTAKERTIAETTEALDGADVTIDGVANSKLAEGIVACIAHDIQKVVDEPTDVNVAMLETRIWESIIFATESCSETKKKKKAVAKPGPALKGAEPKKKTKKKSASSGPRKAPVRPGGKGWKQSGDQCPCKPRCDIVWCTGANGTFGFRKSVGVYPMSGKEIGNGFVHCFKCFHSMAKGEAGDTEERGDDYGLCHNCHDKAPRCKCSEKHRVRINFKKKEFMDKCHECSPQEDDTETDEGEGEEEEEDVAPIVTDEDKVPHGTKLKTVICKFCGERVGPNGVSNGKTECAKCLADADPCEMCGENTVSVKAKGEWAKRCKECLAIASDNDE